MLHNLLVNIVDNCNKEIQKYDCVGEHNEEPEKPDEQSCCTWQVNERVNIKVSQ